jgi:peroxiredoxin
MSMSLIILCLGMFLHHVETPKELASHIDGEFQKALQNYEATYDAAITAAKQEKLPNLKVIFTESASKRSALAEKYPESVEGFRARVWVAENTPTSELGKQAIAKLNSSKMLGQPPTEIIKAFDAASTIIPRPISQLTETCFQACQQHPNDSETGRLLATVCLESRLSAGDKPPKLFREAADLIVAKYAADKGISHFCESLCLHGVPNWAAEFESHLHTIAERNPKPLVLLTSRYSLCEIELARGADHEQYAAKQFEQYAKDFEKETKKSGVAKVLVSKAKDHVQRLKTCAMGMEAPAFTGTDLNGKVVSLKDYRGKVLVLVFWTSSCVPCMKEVPHELGWLKSFQDRPFAILGINGDDNLSQAKLAVKNFGMTWPSLADEPTKQVQKLYHIAAYPTVYVIDHTGIIRQNHLRGAALDLPLEALIQAAEKAK